MSNTMVSKVELSFGAQGLKSKDLLSKSDPFAELYFLKAPDSNARSKAAGKPKLVLLGKTERIGNTDLPVWNACFIVDFHFESIQQFVLRIFDYDRGSNHDLLGEALFTLGNVMGSKGQRLAVNLTKPGKKDLKRGQAIIRGRQVDSNNKMLHFRMRGRKFDSKDWGGLGRSDPFYVFSSVSGAVDGKVQYQPVLRGEYVASNNSPTWVANHVPLGRLCNGDVDAKFKIEVFDHDRDGTHDLIGEALVSVRELMDASGRGTLFPMVHPPTKRKYTKSSYKHSGEIEILSAAIEQNPSMLDYIQGGCELNLIMAVDYTQSNGDPRNRNSLHYTGGGGVMNSYQHAMWEIGNILQEYDHDKQFPLFGFGGVFNGATSHCFPVNGDPYHPEVQGVDGLFQTYTQSLQTIPLSGPTYFGEIIERAAAYAYNPEVSQQQQKYTVLVILTDGIINDMQRTIDAIVAASSLALSIVIVGVGNADFSGMNALDADTQPLISSSGVKCERDIVQFVAFNSLKDHDPVKLAAATLAEIPNQLISFFKKYKIAPLPPPPMGEGISAGPPVLAGAGGGASAPMQAGALPPTLAHQGKNMLAQAFAL